MPYDNTNRGAIWKNDKKRPDKNDPDYTGNLNVDGREFWVSAWKRKDDAPSNAPPLSFTVKPKEQKAERPAQQPAPTRHRADIDDEVPF